MRRVRVRSEEWKEKRENEEAGSGGEGMRGREPPGTRGGLTGERCGGESNENLMGARGIGKECEKMEIQ